MTKPRTRQLPADRRLELIEATIDCLKRFGHEGLSIRKISAQAKVSVGLINHHFPNKDDLIAQAYGHFSAQLFSTQQLAVANALSTPRARLSAFIKATFSPPNLDRDVLSAWVVFWGMLRHSKPIQRVHEQSYHGYLALVHQLLADIEREVGEFELGLRLSAIGFTALLDGLWLEWCLDPDTFNPTEATALCESWISRAHDNI